MSKIIERLKSPVVILQLISVIGAVVMHFFPQVSDTVKYIVDTVVIVYNIFAGLNNPSDKLNF